MTSLFICGMGLLQVLFARTYDNSGNTFEIGGYVVRTADSGYVITGYTGMDAFSGFPFVLKTDPAGVPIWNRFFGLPGGLSYSLTQTQDGGYAFASSAYSGSYRGAVVLVKLDSLGDTLWAKAYRGGVGSPSPISTIQTSDGGYAVSGYLYNYTQPDSAGLFVIKTDSSGNLEWAKILLRGGIQELRGQLIQALDGGYVVTGRTSDLGAGGEDIVVFKLRSDGSLEWGRVYGGASDDRGISLVCTPDSGYTVVGYTSSFGNGGRDIFLMKLSSSGDMEWARTYGDTLHETVEAGQCIVQTSDSGYVIAGNTYSFSGGTSSDILFLKTDYLGNLSWGSVFAPSDSDDVAYTIIKTESGYAACGNIEQFNDLLLLSFNDNGDYENCFEDYDLAVDVVPFSTSSFSAIEDYVLTSSSASISVGNNLPSMDDLCAPLFINTDDQGTFYEDIRFGAVGNTVYLYTAKPLFVSLALFDISGRLIRELHNGVISSGKHTFVLEPKNAGIYLTVLRYAGGLQTAKVLIE